MNILSFLKNNCIFHIINLYSYYWQQKCVAISCLNVREREGSFCRFWFKFYSISHRVFASCFPKLLFFVEFLLFFRRMGWGRGIFLFSFGCTSWELWIDVQCLLIPQCSLLFICIWFHINFKNLSCQHMLRSLFSNDVHVVPHCILSSIGTCTQI